MMNYDDNQLYTDDEEVYYMPVVELVECERVAYVKGMEEYLQKLKSLPASEAKKKSQENLKHCHVIEEDGNFTERYHYSRLMCTNHKG